MISNTTTQAMLKAAAVGDFERVQQLAQVGADLNTLDDGETLLDRAVSAFTLPDSVQHSPPTCCVFSSS